MDNNYLEHHGILGQKWGVRRTPQQLGHAVASGAKKAGAYVHKKRVERNVRKGKLGKLSEQELKSYIDRLTKEKTLKDLRDSLKSNRSRLIGQVAGGAAKKLAGGALDIGVKQVLGKVKSRYEISLKDMMGKDLSTLKQGDLKKLKEMSDNAKNATESMDNLVSKTSKFFGATSKNESAKSDGNRKNEFILKDVLGKDLSEFSESDVKRVKNMLSGAAQISEMMKKFKGES